MINDRSEVCRFSFNNGPKGINHWGGSKGNRAPMVFGAHTPVYSVNDEVATNATMEDRRAALADFINYALTKPDVRIVSMKELLDWLRNPVALETNN